MKRHSHPWLASSMLLLVLAAGSPARAQDSATVMPYHGRLELSGEAHTGSLEMIFRLFETASGGTALWSETQLVEIHGGLFSTLLGKTTPISDALHQQPTLYLEIEVDGVTLAGRQQLGAAPFSVHDYLPSGMVVPFAGAAAPTGWLLCDGRAVSRASYPLLFAAVGTTYGVGDGSTTFNLPDLRGRMPLGKDNMGGTAANRVTAAQADALGGGAGAQDRTLTTSELPAHTHSATGSSGAAGSHHHEIFPALSGHTPGPGSWLQGASYQFTGGYGDAITGDDGSHSHTISVTVQSAGSGQAFSVMNPYTTLNYLIKY